MKQKRVSSTLSLGFTLQVFATLKLVANLGPMHWFQLNQSFHCVHQSLMKACFANLLNLTVTFHFSEWALFCYSSDEA